MKNADSASSFGGMWVVRQLVILFGCFALLVFAASQWRHIVRPAESAAAPAVAETSPASLTFGEFQPITGTPYLIAGLSPHDDSRGSYFSKEGVGAARNYLLLRGDTQESHFLLPDNAHIVRTLDQMHTGDGTNANRPTQWLYAEIIEADSNHDGTLSGDDRFSVAIADPDGANLKTVLTDVTSLLGKSRLRRDALLVLYEKGGKSWASEVDLPNRRIVKSAELPLHPPASASRTAIPAAL